MKNKINIQKIASEYGIIDGFSIYSNTKTITEKFHEFCHELCKQALELAAENAVAIGGGSYYNGEHLEEDPIRVVKGSILNTINQIE